MTTSEIEQKIQDIHVALSANPDPNTRQKLELGLEIFQSLLLAEQQKKSEIQPSQNTGQLPQANHPRQNVMINPTLEELKGSPPTKTEMQEWAKKEEQQASYAHVETSEKQPTYTTTTTENTNIKTVKAPAFVAPDELINVILEDAKGNEYTRIGTKAQVRALTRKYFSNVHESWMGKERKMKTGFKNLLSYVVAWKEFDGALPVLRDVLPDYDRYNKGGESKEASEAFKVAQELYGKIVEILNDVK